MTCSGGRALAYGPLFLKARIVTGFQRGSRDLGYPTANLSPEDIGKDVFEKLEPGVYVGWAALSGKFGEGGPFKAAVSIGWNPVYQNKEKTVEPYLLHKFSDNFYGEEMRLCICGYIRPMLSFDSLESLIKAIENDCKVTEEFLDKEGFKEYKENKFLHQQS